MGLTDVNLKIREEQREWARDNHLNLSSFLRGKLDEEMD